MPVCVVDAGIVKIYLARQSRASRKGARAHVANVCLVPYVACNSSARLVWKGVLPASGVVFGGCGY